MSEYDLIENKADSFQNKTQVAKPDEDQESSYSRIIKSSSIMGGSAAVTMAFSLLRAKCAALLIGTAGVGLVTTFSAIQNVTSVVAGLGIGSSAVRDIAAAAAKDDEQAIGRAIFALRRICWLTGLIGLATFVMVSPIISLFTFGTDKHDREIASLGLVILFFTLSGGQMAIIQGMRRIGDIARINIISGFLATILTLALYMAMGIGGIVPALIVSALLLFLVSSLYVRRISIPVVSLTWRQTFQESGKMVRLGLAMMWSGLLVNAVTYAVVAMINHKFNLTAVGIYSAAFVLSGVLVNFVLQAMSADYYPRLSNASHSKEAMVRLVNEQTEVGLLLATPGLVATICFSPWLIRLFYSAEFMPAADLLPWFVLGCFGRVISFPLGFVMIALGKSKWFFMTETTCNLFHIFLAAILLNLFGLKGISITFPCVYILYTIIVYTVAKILIQFQWRPVTTKNIIYSITLILLSFINFLLFPKNLEVIFSVTLSILSLIFLYLGISTRIKS